jgi:hypothetical protein
MPWRLYLLPLLQACPADLLLLVSVALSEKSGATGEDHAVLVPIIKLTVSINPHGHLKRDRDMSTTRS